jgi:hypothetical protein
MSRNAKIVLVIVSTSLLSCVMLCATTFILLPRLASNAFKTGQMDSKKVASQIADYVLPPGYEEAMGLDMFFYQTVTIAPTSGRGVTIMLMQMNSVNANREQFDQQMRQVFEKQLQTGSGAWRYAGERTVTIKNNPTVLTISEVGSPKVVMRQAQGVFTGKRGVVMFSAMGSGDEWDWDMLDSFFQSIR